MKVAIMQPYFFPYLGYFQLIHAADHFVFYDDVNFIKGGWINRNRILIHNQGAFLSIPCKKISSNKIINEVEVLDKENINRKLLRTLDLAYKKAPFYHSLFPFLENLLWNMGGRSLSELNISTIREISALLNINTTFHIS